MHELIVQKKNQNPVGTSKGSLVFQSSGGAFPFDTVSKTHANLMESHTLS